MSRRLFTLRGQPWRWLYVKRFGKGGQLDGLTTWHGSRPGGVIRIHRKTTGQDRLETEIHEAMHACLPDLDESAVTETARDIAGVLWALGYRYAEADED